MHARVLVQYYQQGKSSFDCARYLNENGVPVGEQPKLEHGETWFETLKEIMWETVDQETGENHSGLMKFFVENTTSKSVGLLMANGIRKDKPHTFTWFLKSIIDEMCRKYGSWTNFEEQSDGAQISSA